MQPVDIKNSLAILVRVLEQAVRDGIIDYNWARITGWQWEYQLAEDKLDDPRSLTLPDWRALGSSPPRSSRGRLTSSLDGATLSSSPPAPRPQSCAMPRTGTRWYRIWLHLLAPS